MNIRLPEESRVYSPGLNLGMGHKEVGLRGHSTNYNRRGSVVIDVSKVSSGFIRGMHSLDKLLFWREVRSDQDIKFLLYLQHSNLLSNIIGLFDGYFDSISHSSVLQGGFLVPRTGFEPACTGLEPAALAIELPRLYSL